MTTKATKNDETTTETKNGKGRPTPKRKDAQAAGLRPLVPADRRASAKAAKIRMREKENAEYEAMQSGDLNRMPKTERLPWRVYIRDYVDARYNLGEYFIPVAFILLILSMIASMAFKNAWASLILMLLMYVFLIAVVVDTVVMWKRLKRKLTAKFGAASAGRGSRSCSYAWSRAIQIRRWRLPKPKYTEHGHYPQD